MKSGPVPIYTIVRPVESWNPLRADPDESFPYIDLGSVDQERKVITGANETRCGDAPSRARQLVKAGDILVSTVRPNLNGVAQVSADLDGSTASTGFCVLRPDSAKVEPRYLMQWVKSPSFIHDMVRKATGASYPAVSDRIVGESLIPLPPLDEQRRIADILDRADALRAKRRAAIARLDELTQAIFVEMFGDPGDNPKAWPMANLADLFDIARGGSPRPIDDFITDDPNGINWIMIGDTSEGGKYISSTKKRIKPEGARRSRTVKPGDFLLTNSMSFGRPYIMKTSGCIHDGWLVLSPRQNNTNADYFYALLGSRAIYAEFARRAAGAVVKNLNIDLVRGVSVPLPPRVEQERFSAAVSQVERLALPLKKAEAQTEILFASLQDRAFRGAL